MDNIEKKFNLKELIWMGFNFICSIAFTLVFATMLIAQDGSGYGLGINLVWIFALDGLMAGICGWAYNRMSQTHKSGNGGAYIYIRTSWGSYAGFLVLFAQYTTTPIIITSQLVSMIRSNFVGSDTFLDAASIFGNWSNLFWDSVGVFVYLLSASILFFGIKFLKKWLNWSSYIKWGSTGILIIAAIILFCMDAKTNINDNVSHSSIELHSFTTAFTSSFFFFLGFETYATMGQNVVNPEKNIGKSVIIVMVLSTAFYIIVTIIFLGALSAHYSSNPNLQIFKILGDKTNKWINWIGVIIMLLCTFSLKSNSVTQMTLYSGAMIESFSREGYFSERYKELDEENIPKKAIKLNIVITILFLIIILLIPDFIQGLMNNKNPVLAFSSFTGEVSLILIIIYLSVILTCLRLSFTKKIKSNWFEILLWSLAFMFLVFQFEEFFRGNIKTLAYCLSQKNISNDDILVIIGSTIQIGLVVITFTFGLLWYKLYYKPKYIKRLENNPEIQENLNKEFVLISNIPMDVKTNHLDN
ncbi:amino acid permease [Spiroplasma endosymbiont of Aspidapion aeneum]|uniref:amino acid permease n=1 Tax=Spiroplasma endosymbiont of Aspidapion aeneum TaxID=3066276 RepID=UPI00313C5731